MPKTSHLVHFPGMKNIIRAPFRRWLLQALLIASLPLTSALAQDRATLQPEAVPAALPCGMPTNVTWNYSPYGAGTPAMRGYSVTIVAPPAWSSTLRT